MNITTRLRQTLEVCDVHRKRLAFATSAVIVTAITITAVTIIKVILKFYNRETELNLLTGMAKSSSAGAKMPMNHCLAGPMIVQAMRDEVLRPG